VLSPAHAGAPAAATAAYPQSITRIPETIVSVKAKAWFMRERTVPLRQVAVVIRRCWRPALRNPEPARRLDRAMALAAI